MQRSMALSDKTDIFAAPPVIVKIERGLGRVSQSRFAHSFRIGRGEECDVQLEDHRVSSLHAEVLWEDARWWLNDLGSKNGTWINGEFLEPGSRHQLEPGDVVELGLLRLVVRSITVQSRSQGRSIE